MIQFNPDGSIKLPGKMAESLASNERLMQSGRCIKVSRQVINERSPKKCRLDLVLSNGVTDNRFIETLYNEFSRQTEAGTKLIKINEKEFQIEIGTCLRRCKDCNALIGELREFLGNMIDEKGTCTFEQRNIAYEDCFD